MNTRLLLSIVSVALIAGPAAMDARQSAQLKLVRALPPSVWSQYRLESAYRPADLYLARDDERKPVVVMIQGSGCRPLFVKHQPEDFENTSQFEFWVPSRRERFHFAMIEKPGVGLLEFPAGATREEKLKLFEPAGASCPAEYLANVRLDVRAQTVAAAIDAITREPWAGPILLLGHSEGTHVVAEVLGRNPRLPIAAAGLLASAGPTPFYAGYLAAGAGNRQAFQAVIDRIQLLQQADDDYMYRGHPARRWKTFWLDTTPLDSIKPSSVPLFVAQGTGDDTVLGADLFVIEAIRQRPNRPVRYVVVEGGGHSFEMRDGRSHFEGTFDDFLKWGLDPGRTTSFVVLK